MIPNPIRKVLSTLANHQVRCLLMDGQACVLYGAAEFSRATDLNLLTEAENLARMSQALAELQAECIAVPPLDWSFLDRGHALHFRCRHPDAHGIRIDVMSVQRGLGRFEELWGRRTTLDLDDGLRIELLSLPDLIQSKKTQRDKDWPMIRRLVEAHHAQYQENPTPDRIGFWLRESRTPELWLELARNYPAKTAEAAAQRPLLHVCGSGTIDQIDAALHDEERREREADRLYWAPLNAELQALRSR